ncbi:hypothetical protein V3C99_014482 [Haemonchus contortus]
MTTLSKAEYLQRYLSSGNEDEKKKKKKKKVKEPARGSGLRIVEDDAFIAVSANYKDIDTDEEKEDIEIIASITKQVEAKAREAPKFRKSFVPLDEVKQEPPSPSAADDTKPESSTSPRRAARSRNDSDASPPRKSKGRHDSDSDISPPRKAKGRHDSDSDISPPRKAKGRHDSDSDISPPRRRGPDPRSSKKRHDSDRSASPRREKTSRKERRRSKDRSPIRKPNDSQTHSKRRRHDSDQSPPRKHESSSQRNRDSRSNSSPSRKPQSFSKNASIKVEVDSDQSPPRREQQTRKRHDSDSDQSPPRKRERPGRKRNDSDSDLSPPRRHERSSKHPAVKTEVDSDQSPPRKDCSRVRTKGSDSDQSPPRKHGRPSSRRQESEKHRERRIATPERLGKEPQKTLDGKVAGLQSAADLKKESEKLREREAKMFEEMDASVSGRNAETTVRQKQVRKGREKPEDKERKEREAKKQQELQEKYQLWNKGVAQAQLRAEQLEEMARVVSEPLARMADDVEMNRHLKEEIYEEDPMAVMLKSKKRKQALKRGDVVYPTYQGECPPNRFGIRPGYRWDGVDRSNGFEAKLAQSKNKRSAEEREYYQNLQLYE